jgi:DNA repair exonuclease SbcCD ATPase subunit
MSGFEASGLNGQGDALLDRALAVEREQAALLDSAALSDQYSSALAEQVSSKHEQVERIEDKLEALIENQSSRLQDAQTHAPGLFSSPGKRAAYHAQLQRQQASLQRLQSRLETVREIAEGMGAHGPKLEELAARKLRYKEPELVEGWEEMREAQRRHEALLRKQEQEKKQQRGLGRSSGLTHTLTITRPK